MKDSAPKLLINAVVISILILLQAAPVSAATLETNETTRGYDNIYAVNVQVKNNQDTPGIDFFLSAEATLSGHVFQSVGNNPIPGALVQVTPLYGGPTQQANSDGTGSFTVGGLASGFYVVSASAIGFEQEFYDNTISADAADAVQLVQPYNKTEVNFTLSVPTLDTPTERPYLIGFYHDNHGTHWYNHSGWDTTDNTCTWYGVACHDGHVAVINLDGNQVSGPISPNLWSLPGLQVLSLQNNQLSGGVPTGLVNLTELRFLNLGYNQLTGAIPTVLAGLTRLGALMLNNNQLGGSIPNTFQNLAKLRMLLLNNNNLTDVIPPEFGYFVALRVLALQNNQLSGGIPSRLGSLNYLTDLDLRNNQLSGSILPELGSLTNLMYLGLSHNLLSGAIPETLGNLTSLTILRMDHNRLAGDIPASLANLTSLVNPGQAWVDHGDGLDLGYNRLNVLNYPDPLGTFLQQKDPNWYLSQSRLCYLPMVKK